MYVYNSQIVQPGDVFLCLPGGEKYCEEALDKGAREIRYVSRKEMADLAHDFYDFPANKLVVIGVTGTNGKTSVCHFVSEALKSLGQKPFFQGTINSQLTTPESLDTCRAMKKHLDSGGTHFVMEVSSHGIAQDRVYGIDFDVACLTNITQDHLDYHGSMDAYRKVKLDFMASVSGQTIYPEYFASLDLNCDETKMPSFELLNKKAALAILVACGHDPVNVAPILCDIKAPEGRFELVDSSAPFKVVVDYAHSPHGLELLLNSALAFQEQSKGKVLVCYGCGGDRDRKKRPLMAQVVSERADYSVITNDNPRTEDPKQIVEDMIVGVQPNHNYEIELDRETAIKKVCQKAGPEDLVLIVGKGHESYQVIGTEKIDFSDSKVAHSILKSLGY